MREVNYLPQWLEYRDSHVRPAGAEFDARVAEGAEPEQVEEAARKYLRALAEHSRRIDNSPGGASFGGDGTPATGALINGAEELYAEIKSEWERVIAQVGDGFPL